MEVKLGVDIKNLYEKMARTMRKLAIDDSLKYSKKVELIWNSFENTNKKVEVLIDTKLLASYNEGCSDLVDTMKKAGENGYKPRFGLPSVAKKSTVVPSELKRFANEAKARLRREGHKAINTLTSSILTRDDPHTEEGIRTKELNELVITAGNIAMELEIRAYAASKERVAI